MSTATLVLSDFEVSETRGFVPHRDPLLHLPSRYKPWEDLADRIPTLLKNSSKLRRSVLELPFLDPTHLRGSPELHRAAVALSTIAHAYVWCEGDAGAPKSLPRNVAVPWTRIAARLGFPPIMTHATFPLHNWKRIDPTGPLVASNLAQIHSITGTEDERWFFVATTALEVVAAPGVKAVVDAQAAANRSEGHALVESLAIMTKSLVSAKEALKRMYDKCRPDVFYNVLRPYLAGWKGSSVYPRGLVYEGAFDDNEPRMFYGGSAAESSLLPCFSEALGISYGTDTDHGVFLREMRSYMPTCHREFLEAVARRGNAIRDFVRSEGGVEARRAYNDVIDALVAFRSFHVQIVTSYVLVQSRKSKSVGHESLVETGTGGTGIMPFLKFARERALEYKL